MYRLSTTIKCTYVIKCFYFLEKLLYVPMELIENCLENIQQFIVFLLDYSSFTIGHYFDRNNFLLRQLDLLTAEDFGLEMLSQFYHNRFHKDDNLNMLNVSGYIYIFFVNLFL